MKKMQVENGGATINQRVKERLRVGSKRSGRIIGSAAQAHHVARVHQRAAAPTEHAGSQVQKRYNSALVKQCRKRRTGGVRQHEA